MRVGAQQSAFSILALELQSSGTWSRAELRMPEPPGDLQVRLTPEAHFAWLRTRLSLERTLMSWMRTATALIGFGFSIVQFFERLSHMEGFKPARDPNLARYMGLMLM